MIIQKIKVGISVGDINGIGHEIIIKTLSDPRIFELCTPIVYGSVKTATFHRKALGIQDFSFNIIRQAVEANAKRANLINCWEEEVKIDLGKDTPLGGQYALKSLEAATDDLTSGKLDALVTAPINKSNMQTDGFAFPGHTEYLQHKAGAKNSLMFMVSERLRLGVVTGHIALRRVAEEITPESIAAKLQLINASLKNDFWIEKPRIAVLGLNPHAGDQGVMGDEEQAVIRPAIDQGFSKGLLAFGPFPADGFFGNGAYEKYDGVLAMYHDQGLIPFKTLSFGQGVNFTAGLGFVRTSPDHGTAYEIAGRNLASETSFREAIYLACDIVRKRKENASLKENPLKITKLSKERE